MDEAQEYAARLTASPPPELAECLSLAAEAFRVGQGIAGTEARQTDMLETMKPPSGWKRGRLGYVSERKRRDVPMLKRRPGGHPTNWPAEQFIPAMFEVAALLRVKLEPPYYDGRDYIETAFSKLCDDWLRVFAPGETIPPKTYRTIIERRN